MKKNNMRAGYFDRSGKFHEVKFIRSAAVFSDEALSPIPNYSEPTEFSCKVECSEDFMKELKDSMKNLDLMILDAYDTIGSAAQCCLDPVRPQCHICPYKGRDQCKYQLMQSVLDIVKNRREEVKQAIEEKWREKDE